MITIEQANAANAILVDAHNKMNEVMNILENNKDLYLKVHAAQTVLFTTMFDIVQAIPDHNKVAI